MDGSSASPRMNQYEKGKHTPDIGTLKALCPFFFEDEVSVELAMNLNKLSETDK